MDADGASGRTNVGPSVRARKKSSRKVNILELPIEILEVILMFLNGKALLRVSHVCKLFASVAETAFARAYAEKFYAIPTVSKSFDRVMLNKYGAKMRKVSIFFGDEELLQLVERECGNLTHLSLSCVPRIIMLTNLQEVSLGQIQNLNRETFANFVNLNPQLETLELISVDLLDVLDGRLNNLKTLKFEHFPEVSLISPVIRLNSLETLHLSLKDVTNCNRVLRTMNCKQIKKLVLKSYSDANERDDDDIINGVCKFKMLVSLDLPLYRITSDRVTELSMHLPNLAEFGLEIADGDSKLVEKIVLIPIMLTKLVKLEIRLGKGDFDRLSKDLKSSADVFHALLTKDNIETKLINNVDMISITADHLHLLQKYSVELHWMKNLNEKDVRKVLSSWDSVRELKFVNNCADRTIDLSALAGRHTQCLDFKSNGPISVKSNFSQYRARFRSLKKLKIHLEQHSAHEFLRNLDANFCEQIEELWLNTRTDTKDPDMTNVLAKFGHLTSLHVAPSSIKFNACHLFSVCAYLPEIKRI